jgi:colanic acid biosynthesis glycosyl transferase WcaI
MRISILTQFYPPEFGAAAVYWNQLAEQFADAGHEVIVLTSVPNYPTGIVPDEYRRRLFYKEHNGRITVLRVNIYASPHKSTVTRLLNPITFMIMSSLRGTFMLRPDVLIVESHPLFVCLAAGWLKLVKRSPILLNVSDLWPESAVATGALRADSLIVKGAERVERWAYKNAAHIIAMTRGVEEGINKVHRQPKRVTMLYNSVDLEKFRPNMELEGNALRKRYGLEGQFVAAHVGNMSLTYDFDLILNVAAQLPEITFIFAGSGSQESYLREQLSNRQLSNVKMLGILSYSEMPALWACADVCLIALGDHSVAGGTMPAKLFEAMATGTPIVAAIRGEAEFVLKETGAGIPTPIGDPQGMIEALHALSKNPYMLTKMSQAGRAYAEAHLSPQHSRDTFLNLINHIIYSNSLKYIND